MANEDKSTRYHRLRRRSALLSAGLGAFLLLVLLISGWSAALRTAAADLAGGSFVGTVFVYVLALLFTAHAISDFLQIAYKAAEEAGTG